MSKKTTTDFRRIIQGQQLRTTHSNPNAGEIVIRIDDILSAVSELVEECIGEATYERVTDTNDHRNTLAWWNGRDELRAEIRQRFKERGITIK